MKIKCEHCKGDLFPESGIHKNGRSCRVYDATGAFWKLVFVLHGVHRIDVFAENTRNNTTLFVAQITPMGYVRVRMNYHVLRFGTRYTDSGFKWNPNHIADLAAYVIRMENASKINVTNLRTDDQQKKGWKQDAKEREQN